MLGIIFLKRLPKQTFHSQGVPSGPRDRRGIATGVLSTGRRVHAQG